MRHQDKLEHFETTEARELVQLLAAANKPQHEIRAPAHFRVNVLQRIEQHQRRHGMRVWLVHAATGIWSPALVALLVLSLGVNVWLGLQTWTSAEMGGQQVAQNGRQQDGTSFDAYAFQSRIHDRGRLGTLAAQHAAVGDQAVTFGFAHQQRGRSYVIGLLYVEALAGLHGNRIDVAAERLATLAHTLTEEQMPPSLIAYVDALHQAVTKPSAADGPSAALLAPFEPLYAEQARKRGPEDLLLFHFGTWLGNLSLAAASGDATALQQGNQAGYFMAAMRDLHGPKGVLAALDRIDRVLAQPTLNDKDVHEVLRLIKKTQRLVGPLGS